MLKTSSRIFPSYIQKIQVCYTKNHPIFLTLNQVIERNLIDHKSPNSPTKPSNTSQTMWINNRAWPVTGAEPPFPTSQIPDFTTRTPAQCASGQPHQYVTPLTPQTGSGRKQLMVQDSDGDGVVGQMSWLTCSEGKRSGMISSERTVTEK